MHTYTLLKIVYFQSSLHSSIVAGRARAYYHNQPILFLGREARDPADRKYLLNIPHTIHGIHKQPLHLVYSMATLGSSKPPT